MKIKYEEVRCCFLALFSVCIFSVQNIFVLNIIFVLFFLFDLIKYRRITNSSNNLVVFFYFLYIIWVVSDVLIVEITRKYGFDSRNLIQLIFEIQYIFLLIDVNLETECLSRWIVRVASFYSLIVIALFFMTGTYKNIYDLYGTAREWGDSFFPGGTTSAPVPFIFSLFIAFKRHSPLSQLLLITIGGFLFPSRVSLLGILIIWIWFTYERMSKIVKILSIVAVILLGFSFAGLLDVIGDKLPSLMDRLTKSWDRMEIMSVTFDKFSEHPILGYGGKTLGQIWEVEKISSESGHIWPHTHNIVLELLIRYGIIGLVFFGSFIFSLLKNVTDKDYKFIIVFMLFMALFQTYFREFYYLFYFILFFTLDRDKQDNLLLEEFE